jgi:hypothetical protein
MPRGGARKGAGTKSPHKNGAYKGMNSKYGESTKVKRVPVSKVNDLDKSFTLISDLEDIIKNWEKQAENAAQESVTGKVPRTYDKLKLLIAELREEFSIESGQYIEGKSNDK